VQLIHGIGYHSRSLEPKAFSSQQSQVTGRNKLRATPNVKRQVYAAIVFALLLSVILTGETAQSQPEQLIGQGRIVAFQKYDRHHKKPYQKGVGSFVEEWVVKIDKWEDGDKSLGYYLVSYEKVSERALGDDKANQNEWRFRFREPVFHEAESCSGDVPVPASDGASYNYRPATIDDFKRTKTDTADTLPALKDLPCLIASEPPIKVHVHKKKPL
jgi:hypothetical protein